MSWSLTLTARVGELDLDVSLDGDDGPVALVGPNGAGKTTVLRWMAGHPLPGARGRLTIDGRVVVDADRRAPPEARGVGYVPQGYGLFAHLSALDNVAFGLASAGQDRETRRAAALALLERMDAAALAERRPAELSGGERQKVALARALAVRPRLLLLDEPMTALDVSARRRTRAFLAEQLAESPGGALLVTHDARDIRALVERVFVLAAGRVVQSGAPEALAAAPANEFVAELFDG